MPNLSPLTLALLGTLAGLLWLVGTEEGGDTLDELTDMTEAIDTADRNVRAFLMMIRVGEGTSDPAGYSRLFGGQQFASFADHPRLKITRSYAGKPITSTAAGAYQFLVGTWDEVRAALDLPDFSPASQDAAAVYLIRRRGALADVKAGRFNEAVRKCAKEWASLPGSPYGQPVKTIQQARATYEKNGGTYA